MHGGEAEQVVMVVRLRMVGQAMAMAAITQAHMAARRALDMGMGSSSRRAGMVGNTGHLAQQAPRMQGWSVPRVTSTRVKGSFVARW